MYIHRIVTWFEEEEQEFIVSEQQDDMDSLIKGKRTDSRLIANKLYRRSDGRTGLVIYRAAHSVSGQREIAYAGNKNDSMRRCRH